MTISETLALKLARHDESDLVQSSFPPALAELSPARLKDVVALARRLHEKYEGLVITQRRAVLEKQNASGTLPSSDNKHTVEKAALFQEAAGRFEAQLARLEPRAQDTPVRSSTDTVGAGAAQAVHAEAAGRD